MREEGEGRAQHETEREYVPAEVEFLFRDRLYVVRAIHVLVLQGVHASPSREGWWAETCAHDCLVVLGEGMPNIGERGAHVRGCIHPSSHRSK